MQVREDPATVGEHEEGKMHLVLVERDRCLGHGSRQRRAVPAPQNPLPKRHKRGLNKRLVSTYAFSSATTVIQAMRIDLSLR